MSDFTTQVAAACPNQTFYRCHQPRLQSCADGKQLDFTRVTSNLLGTLPDRLGSFETWQGDKLAGNLGIVLGSLYGECFYQCGRVESGDGKLVERLREQFLLSTPK